MTFSEQLDDLLTTLLDDKISREVYEAKKAKIIERATTAEKNYQFMVNKAMDEKLDGYRALGAKAAAAENRVMDLEKQIAESKGAMPTYHLMLEEDVPLCGSHNAALTYRDDVADCPDCWRKLSAKLRDERTNMEKMKNALAAQLIVAADKGMAFRDEAKDWHKLADERSAALNDAMQHITGLEFQLSEVQDQLKQTGICDAWTGKGGTECGKCYECLGSQSLVVSNQVATERDTAKARIILLEETLSAFPGLNSDTEDVIKWINKVSKVIG